MKTRAYITLSIVAIALFFVGCNKKLDTIAKIYIYNNSNELVPECRVVLWGQSSQSNQGNVVLYDTAYTNAAGEAIFYYNDLYQKGMAGVAILKIEARKGNYRGEGIVKVVEEQTNEATVYIAP